MGGYYTVAMRICFFLALLLAGKAFAQELPSWFALSLLVLPEEIAAAAQEKKRVVLYFEQDGCPYCKRMVEVNFRDPAIARRMQERFVPIALNIWGDREVTPPGPRPRGAGGAGAGAVRAAPGGASRPSSASCRRGPSACAAKARA